MRKQEAQRYYAEGLEPTNSKELPDSSLFYPNSTPFMGTAPPK